MGSQSSASSWSNVSVEKPLPIRPLVAGDNAKGFIDLLSQLSRSPAVSDDAFQARLNELTVLGNDHQIVVIEDPISGRIVATGSVFIERKFLRNCSKVGHIEDVVVDATARGRGFGQMIVKHLAEYARLLGCYKVILDCSPELRGFYENCGFEEKNIQMAIYFDK